MFVVPWPRARVTRSTTPSGESQSTVPSIPVSVARWLGAAASTLSAGLAANAAVLGSRRLGFRLISAWASGVQRSLGIDLEITDENEGRYDEPPYVFLWLNQDSLVDSLVCVSVLPGPCRLLTNVEFAAIPVVGWYSLAERTPVLVRQSRALSRFAFEKAVRMARQGDNFCVSIEGWRNHSEGLGTYRKTPVLFALRAEATIVPVFLRGTAERLPFGEWRVRPGAVHARLLKAIPTRGLGVDARHDLVAHLRALAEEQLRGATTGVKPG